MMGRIDNQMQLLILDLDSMIPENRKRLVFGYLDIRRFLTHNDRR